jgi:DNA-binding winged helix-turn-helix (wHTH) protein/TolB-like protein
MQLKAGTFYEWGEFRLEPAEHRLTRDGAPVALPPKAFELLVLLVRNQGRLMTKNEIMRVVWPNSFVEEANLTVSVSILRKVLCEKGNERRFIETIPTKGYRFIAPVKETVTPALVVMPSETAHLKQPEILRFPPPDAVRVATAAQPLPANEDDTGPEPVGPALVPRESAQRHGRRYLVLMLLSIGCIAAALSYLAHLRTTKSAHPAIAQRTLAILPFHNLGHSSGDDFLGYSLADAVITKLSGVSSLTVRPSSSIEKYKNQTIDPVKVAADLNVDSLLTGNFIHDGDDLRITYQLFDVRSDKILARDSIDLKYEKLLTVQDNVTWEIIRGLALNLSPAESAYIKPEEAINPLAYEYYLRGVDLVGSHDFPLAAGMLEKSVEIDPNYALTWAYLGQSYEAAAAFELGGREQYRRAQAAYERALALQPKQLEARMFLANLLIDTGNVEKAVPLLREAQKDAPTNASVYWELGYAYRFAGKLTESVAECERALQIDPLVKGNGAVLNTYLYLGKYDQFLASLPEAGDSSFLTFYRGFAKYHLKQWDQAARDFDRAWQLDQTLYTQTGKAIGDSISNRNSEGRELLQDLEKKIQQRGVGDPEGTYKIAEAYALLGDKDASLRMLRYSIDHGFFSWPYFQSDPLLVNIRHEPQYAALMSVAYDRYKAFDRKFF